MSVYAGKDSERLEQGSPSAIESVVMRLSRELWNAGRSLYVDNFYTSIPLAFTLLENKTHLVGTMRANRKK